VLDADDDLVLEIADDQVESGSPDAESTYAWREVEVELGLAGKKRDLKQARKLLQAAGATPSAIGTKLDRALALMSAENQQPAALAPVDCAVRCGCLGTWPTPQRLKS
jgi:inorganic triphosphatase YgiF